MFSTIQRYFSPFASKNEELSLLQIFKPLYILLAVLGLFPCTIEFPKGKRDFKVVSQSSIIINPICAFLIILTVYIFFALHMQELSIHSQNSSLSEGVMTELNYIIELVTQLLFCTTSYICALRKKNLYVSMLNDMAESWAALPYVNRGIILGRLRVKINCVVLGSLILVLITLLTVTYAGTSDFWKMVLITLSFALPEMIQFIVVVFYFVMVLMVVALLTNIEHHARMLLKARRNFKGCFKVESGEVPITLCHMRGVYVRALAIKRQINAAFQAPLLLTLAQAFHTLVSEAHTIYHGLAFQKNFTTHDVIECSCWILFQLLKIYALAHSGSLLKSEAQKIGQTIHNIPINIDEDITLFIEIQHFSTLMKYQDTEISIYGFFLLDAPLMFNIIASAAMYLIILVQFDKVD